MKRSNFLILIFAGLLFACSISAVNAQNEMSPDAPNKQPERENRPNLLAELGLSPEQLQQIQRVNKEKRPLMREAQQRLREATRNLDQAIYADNANETEIQARLKDAQAAQAELMKIRVANELVVRRILTAEQLAKFRGLREQFAQKLENNPDNQQKSLQNMKQRLRMRRNQMRPID